jgi:hypothetical protein
MGPNSRLKAELASTALGVGLVRAPVWRAVEPGCFSVFLSYLLHNTNPEIERKVRFCINKPLKSS